MKIINMFDALDYKGILAEYLIHNGLDFALGRFDSKIKEQNETKKSNKHKNIFDFENSRANIEDRICQSLVQTYNYTKDISFKDINTPKLIVDAFVEPNFFYSQRRTQIQDLLPEREDMHSIFTNCVDNLVILGDLGAGKTTLIKKLCQSLILKDEKYYNGLTFPILIRLREINGYSSEIPSLVFFEFLLNKLGFVLRDFSKDQIRHTNSYTTNLKRIVCDFLEDINILLLLDGYDEINDLKVRKTVIEDLEMLSNSFVTSKVIITSRTAEFIFDISNTTTYEIAPLSDDQIDVFINQYINKKDEAEKFKLQLFETPYFDTSRKPLALAHLCAIYERYHSLPSKPKTVYKKIVSLYIEEWDAQRRIDRIKTGGKVSEYNNLPNDRKFEFITKFAYLLTTEFNSSTFSEKDITKCYNLLFQEFDLPSKQSKIIVREIEGHNGLIIQTSQDTFEFSHKSIHEYLVAEYISRMGTLPKKSSLLLSIPNELAIATALSSEPNLFLFRLFVKYLKINANNPAFVYAFLNRIHVEKPDFRVESILGFTLAYLYSILKFGDINAIRNKKTFPNAKDLQNTNYLLLKLIRSMPNVKASIKKFNQNYEADYSYRFKSKTEDYSIVRAKLVVPIEGYSKNDQPEFLVVPAFFL
jgi:GTPase SAR1 family protein